MACLLFAVSTLQQQQNFLWTREINHSPKGVSLACQRICFISRFLYLAAKRIPLISFISCVSIGNSSFFHDRLNKHSSIIVLSFSSQDSFQAPKVISSTLLTFSSQLAVQASTASVCLLSPLICFSPQLPCTGCVTGRVTWQELCITQWSLSRKRRRNFKIRQRKTGKQSYLQELKNLLLVNKLFLICVSVILTYTCFPDLTWYHAGGNSPTELSGTAWLATPL